MKKYIILLLFVFSCVGKNTDSNADTTDFSTETYSTKTYTSRKKNEYGGVAKIGKPYEVLNQKYTPKYQDEYEEVGIASWYGPNFHGKKTANGEMYNQNALTAAHRTLSIPCMVEVANLENGKSMVLRVNDRGPFVNNRIIDLSKNAAKKLGILEKGTGKVKVTLLKEETHRMLEASYGDPFILEKMAGVYEEYADDNGEVLEMENIKIASLDPIYLPVSSKSSNKKSVKVARRRDSYRANSDIINDKQIKFFVQVGMFGVKQNAQGLVKRLSYIGRARIDKVLERGRRTTYRVRFGTFTKKEAKNIVKKLKKRGYSGFIIRRI